MRRVALVLLSLIVIVPTLAEPAARKKAAAPAAKQPPAAAGPKSAATPKARKKAAAPAAPAAAQPSPAAGAKAAAAKAKTAKTKAAKQAKDKDNEKEKAVPKASPALIAAYGAMPAAERRAIQGDLFWTGDYHGIVGDDFGDRSIAAVKSYQARSGAVATGLLTAEQRAGLVAAARAKQDAAGWRVVDDAATGIRLAIPIKRAPQTSAIPGGTRWSSARGEVQITTFRFAEPGTTLAAVFERQKKTPAGRQVEFAVMRDNFFVLSGLQGLKRFHVWAHVKDNDVRGVAMMYDQAMEGIMDPVAVAMSSRFQPFPGAAAAPARRKVEYATAVVVDRTGQLITDRQATEDCQVITLAGLGNAERIAEAENVALLRVYGARALEPIAMAPDGAGPPNVTLVGIADPQAQDGNDVPSALVARIGSAEEGLRPLNPVPAPGFSGAAALDPQGRLVGMGLVRTATVAGPAQAAAQAQLASLQEIEALLRERNVAPAQSGASTPEAAMGSVFRVICVRK